MSTITDRAVVSRAKRSEDVRMQDKKAEVNNYKGFVGGVFSGIAKLTGKLLIRCVH